MVRNRWRCWTSGKAYCKNDDVLPSKCGGGDDDEEEDDDGKEEEEEKEKEERQWVLASRLHFNAF